MEFFSCLGVCEGSDSKAFEFVSKLFANVKRMNLASGDARTAFVDQGVGDVLLIWENEANLILKKKGGDRDRDNCSVHVD